MIKTLQGLVLTVEDYRDQDVILHVLCKEEGMQSIVARGIRKLSSKNAGVCQPYTHAKFYVNYHEGKGMHGLRTADSVKRYRNIHTDLKKQSMAAVICECLKKADIDNGFAFLKEALDDLEQTTQPYALLALCFSCMNRMLGIEPFVDGCVHCGSTKGICSISVPQGGFLCQTCVKEPSDVVYDKTMLKSFRLLCKAQLQQFPILETYQDWNLEHFMSVYRFFDEYSGISIKSLKFLLCLEERM